MEDFQLHGFEKPGVLPQKWIEISALLTFHKMWYGNKNIQNVALEDVFRWFSWNGNKVGFALCPCLNGPTNSGDFRSRLRSWDFIIDPWWKNNPWTSFKHSPESARQFLRYFLNVADYNILQHTKTNLSNEPDHLQPDKSLAGTSQRGGRTIFTKTTPRKWIIIYGYGSKIGTLIIGWWLLETHLCVLPGLELWP